MHEFSSAFFAHVMPVLESWRPGVQGDPSVLWPQFNCGTDGECCLCRRCRDEMGKPDHRLIVQSCHWNCFAVHVWLEHASCIPTQDACGSVVLRIRIHVRMVHHRENAEGSVPTPLVVRGAIGRVSRGWHTSARAPVYCYPGASDVPSDVTGVV